jgi:hypothetical protein
MAGFIPASGRGPNGTLVALIEVLGVRSRHLQRTAKQAVRAIIQAESVCAITPSFFSVTSVRRRAMKWPSPGGAVVLKPA